MTSRSFLVGSRLLLSSLFLACVLPIPSAAFAEGTYLPPNHPDGVSLLPPPPDPASAEGVAELAFVRSVVHDRSAAEKERAQKDSTLAFSLFQPAIGPIFDLERLPKTDALLQKVKKEIGDPIDAPKNHFKRLRPYQLDETLSLGKPEPSFGYPSGHSTRGTVYAMVLAELFPGNKSAILQIGRDIGWDRVIIGKHFPSDIQAGRMLGQAIVRELLQSPSFQHDLAQAKAEINTVKIAAAPKSEPAKTVPAPVTEPAGVR
jgi:acid phosphatase (class A)